MDSIHSSLITLENLSKQISNLIYHNSFEKIPELDLQRQSLIKSIYINKEDHLEIKEKLKKLMHDNDLMIINSDNKLKKLNLNHNKFNKRLKAYSNIE